MELKWYHYIAAFFAGAFLCNSIPHLVNGISGDAFPTPFADPPGKGLSSPVVNVGWALLNLLAGYLLYRGSRMNAANKLAVFLFFLAVALMSINLAILFSEKESGRLLLQSMSCVKP